MRKKFYEALMMFQDLKWESGLLYKKGQAICNYFPFIERKSQSISTGNIVYHLVLFIGEAEESVIGELTEEEISKIDHHFFRRLSDRCVRELGVKPSVFKDVMEHILCKQTAVLTKTSSYIEELGWHTLPDGSHLYCMGNKLVGAESYCKDHEVIISPFLTNNFKKKAEEIMEVEEAFKLCRAFLKEKLPIITIFILALPVAYLRKLYIEAGVPPEISLVEYGPTATGKTTLAKYFCSFYGNSTDLGGMLAELESTAAAIERKASIARDCLFLVDDIPLREGKKRDREKEEIASKMIRRLYSGQGAEKSMGKQNGISKINGLLVLTAEEMLDNPSTMNRTIFVEMKKMPPKDIRKKMNDNPYFARSLAYYLIRWAADNYDKVVKVIKECDQEFKKEKLKNFDPRIQSSIRILRIAKILLLECARDYSQGWRDDCSEEIDGVCTAVLKRMKEQIKQMQLSGKRVDIAEFVINGIKKKQLSIAGSYKEGRDMEWLVRYAGFWHKDNIYLEPDELQRYLKKRLGKEFTSNIISRALTESGLLLRDKSETAKKKFNGKYYWVLDGSIVSKS